MAFEDDVRAKFSELGLSPELFPVFYHATAPFLDGNGQPSGVAGARATLTRDLPNFPHVFFGIRVTNVYPFPAQPADADVALFPVLKQYIDPEQTITVDFSQQNITGQAIPLDHMCGRDAMNWHPFPVPYLLAGANQIQSVVERITSYPTFAGADVHPVCRMTYVCGVLRADFGTIAPQRIRRG